MQTLHNITLLGALLVTLFSLPRSQGIYFTPASPDFFSFLFFSLLFLLIAGLVQGWL
jgi:hypothetical protein